jgi:hypothetical protein
MIVKPIQSAILALIASLSLASAAIEITAAPGGSLIEARDAIRAKRQAGEQGPAVITLGDGRYNFSEQLGLDASDSNLTIRAAKGAKPLLIGGTVVTGFRAHQGQILKADVSALLKQDVIYRQLLYGGKRMILARYPNFTPADPLYGGWAYVDDFAPGADPEGEEDAFPIKSQDVRKWEHPEDVEVDIFCGDAYWNNIRSFQSYDPSTRKVMLAGSGSWGLRRHSRFHFQNVLEELDSPGEWFLDPRTKILYFWPPAVTGSTEVRLVTLDNLIHIKDGANHISLERLVFTGCNGSAINITNAEDCLVAGCTITTVGGYSGPDSGMSPAIVINGGKHNFIRSNDISYTGGSGISVNGGDRITLTPAGHEVTNNDIHHVGIYDKGSSDIDVSGCGIFIAHNLLHDSPRIGVQMDGNRLIAEYNHLYQLCLETNDCGALYTGGRDWIGGRGTIWRYNRIHDIIGCAQGPKGLIHPAMASGIYPDDNAGGMDIIGNLVYRVGCAGLHLHNARDCVVENNIFAFAGDRLFDFQGWLKHQKMFTEHFKTMIEGYESVANQPAWKGMRGMELHPKKSFRDDGTVMSGNVLRRNIMFSDNAKTRYPSVSNATPKWNTVDRNLVWNSGHPIVTNCFPPTDVYDAPVVKMSEWQAWQNLGWDKNSMVADPQFENAAKDDFRLKTGSPAIRQIGFVPLPIDEMGLVQDKWRTPIP